MKNSMLGSPVGCFGLCTQNHSFVGLLSCIYYSHFTGLKFHVLFLLHVKILKFCAFRMAKTIIDAILSLSLDDSTSNLAAAALFYVLTSDVSSLCFIPFLSALSCACTCFVENLKTNLWNLYKGNWEFSITSLWVLRYGCVVFCCLGMDKRQWLTSVILRDIIIASRICNFTDN